MASIVPYAAGALSLAFLLPLGPTARGQDIPDFSVELAARPGIGFAFYDVPSSTAVPTIGENRRSALAHLGTMIGARHGPTGVGAILSYVHVFQGLWDSYGTHAAEMRFSKLLRLPRRYGFSVGFLFELGAAYARGGGTEYCESLGGVSKPGCTPPKRTVDVALLGPVAAVGVQFHFNVFLVGIELSYRAMIGIEGPLRIANELLPLARVGFHFDVGGQVDPPPPKTTYPAHIGKAGAGRRRFRATRDREAYPTSLEEARRRPRSP